MSIISLGLLPGDTYGGASAINNVGQIVGDTAYNIVGGSVEHGVLWQNGTVTDISNGMDNVSPTSLNDAGTIVGQFMDTDMTYKAFVREGSTLVDLGTRLTTPLPSGIYPHAAIAINNNGAILVNTLPTNSSQECWVLLQPVQ